MPYADLHEASECLVKALLIRQRYMIMAGQSFPSVMTRFLHYATTSTPADDSDVLSEVHSAGGENGENSSDSGRLFDNFDCAVQIVKYLNFYRHPIT